MSKTIFSKRGIIAISALASIAIFMSAGLAWAHKDSDGRFGKGWDCCDPEDMAENMTERLSSRLDLSDGQEESVEGILLESHTIMSERREEAQARFAEAFTSNQLSPAQAAELLNTRERMRAEMQGSFANAMSKVHAVLTPEQREKAVELFANSRMSHMGMMGNGWGRGHHDGWGRHGR